MAIKISGSTIIDDSRNIGNAGVITATSYFGDGSGLTGVGIGSTGDINTSGIITAYAVYAEQFVGTGDKLIFSPTPTSFSPVDGATGVNALSSPNISITYDQPVVLGVGTITLRKDSSTGTIVESYNVGVSTRATISNQTLTIDPTNNFDYDQEYYVVVPSGGITNYVGGNNTILDTYNFTTEAGPLVTSFNPTDGATGVAVNSNIVVTFNKNIRAGVGTITLRTVSAGGTITESYDVTSSGRLTFSTNTLTIDPTSNLANNTNYYVVVPDDAVAGYAGTNTYDFTTQNIITVTSYSPTNGSTNQASTTNIALTFDGPPTRGTGTITLRSGSAGGTILESFDAASSNRISIAGNIWTLDPTSNLPTDISIFLVIPNTAINGYAGLNIGGGTASYSFTAAPALGDAYEGGYLICQSGGVRWVVAPSSSEVSRNWYSRADANTTAQQVSGCTGWFVPTCGQMQNPGWQCRTYWDSPFSPFYWTDTQCNAVCAWLVYGPTGNAGATTTKNFVTYVRSFRCVTY